jgi:hypothetical protein
MKALFGWLLGTAGRSGEAAAVIVLVAGIIFLVWNRY